MIAGDDFYAGGSAELWDQRSLAEKAQRVIDWQRQYRLLEGVYSARPELHDVLDILVLLDTPPEQRRRQLVERECDHYRAEWEARWSAAEDHYFGVTMPPHCFERVL